MGSMMAWDFDKDAVMCETKSSPRLSPLSSLSVMIHHVDQRSPQIIGRGQSLLELRYLLQPVLSEIIANE